MTLEHSNAGPDVGELRNHLETHNGIMGLEILDPSEVEAAVRIFRRDGFVVIGHALAGQQLATLRTGVDEAVAQIVALEPDRSGNRGSHSVESFSFDRIYGGWWGRVVTADSPAAIRRSADRYTAHPLRPRSPLRPLRPMRPRGGLS